MTDGDLVVFSGRSLVDRVVQLGTLSLYSHIAIYSDGLLFESTSADLPACEVMGKKVKGSQAHIPMDRIMGYDGSVWVLPLKYPVSTPRELTRYLVGQCGRPYDYIGAARSGGFFWNRVMRVIHKESLDALFCSELCAAALNHVGKFNTGNASSWSPAKLVRHLKRRGLVRKMYRLK